MILIDTQFFGGRGGSSGGKGSGKAVGGSARISNSFPAWSQANAMAEYLENAGYKVSIAHRDDDDYIGNKVNLVAEREIRVPYKDFKNENLTGEEFTLFTSDYSSGVSEIKGSYDAGTKTIALKETLVILTSVNPKLPVKGNKTEFVENKIKRMAVNKPYLLNAIKYKK